MNDSLEPCRFADEVHLMACYFPEHGYALRRRFADDFSSVHITKGSGETPCRRVAISAKRPITDQQRALHFRVSNSMRDVIADYT
jgi:hypothetical protein